MSSVPDDPFGVVYTSAFSEYGWTSGKALPCLLGFLEVIAPRIEEQTDESYLREFRETLRQFGSAGPSPTWQRTLISRKLEQTALAENWTELSTEMAVFLFLQLLFWKLQDGESLTYLQVERDFYKWLGESAKSRREVFETDDQISQRPQ
jgi:hypothetical protein